MKKVYLVSAGPYAIGFFLAEKVTEAKVKALEHDPMGVEYIHLRAIVCKELQGIVTHDFIWYDEEKTSTMYVKLKELGHISPNNVYLINKPVSYEEALEIENLYE